MIQKCIVYILIIFMGFSGDFFVVYCNHWRQLLTYRNLKKKKKPEHSHLGSLGLRHVHLI